METAGKIQDFFIQGPGILSAKMLRDGARIKIDVDGDDYTLEVAEEKLQVKPGVVGKIDVTWSMNKAAFDYVFSSKSWDEVRSRVQEVSFYPNEEKNAKLHVDMTDDEISDYSWRGYHYWARRMGFGL
jgi:hypothetical protein